MPYRDATGPLGEGSFTGRGAGPCVGAPGFRRLGRGGWGLRHWFRATGLPYWARSGEVSEEEALQQRLTWLESRVERVRSRLAELRKTE